MRLSFCLLCLMPFNMMFGQIGPETILTIPKAGTNMLLKLLFLIDQEHGIDVHAKSYQHTYREHKVYWHHAWKTTKDDVFCFGPNQTKIDYIQAHQLKILLIVRDPRDLAIALTNKNPDKTPISAALDETIKHPGRTITSILNHAYFSKYSSMTALYEDYLQWSQYPFTYTSYFEKLVDPKGGGTKKEQIEEILNIANFIDKPLTYQQAEHVASKLFGNTTSFVKGQINRWKTEFTEDQKKAFLLKEEGLLKKLGYALE